MKKATFTIILIAIWHVSFAQRHVVGQKGLEISAGIMDNFSVLNSNKIDKAYFIQGAYSWYNQKENYWKISANYSEKRYESELVSQPYYPVKQYTSDFMYFNKILSDRARNFYLNFGIGSIVGYQTVNNGNYILANGSEIKDRNSFIYGAAAGADGELFLTDKAILLIGVRERYTINSDVQKLHLHFGLGVKFIIY